MGTGDGEQASNIFIQAGKLTGIDTLGGGVSSKEGQACPVRVVMVVRGGTFN